MKKSEKITLDEIIKLNRGLNVLTNSGIGFKDIELSFELSLFKSESTKHIEAFQAVVKELKGTEEEKNTEVEVLLEKVYELKAPIITLKALKTSEKEIPLLAFDYLSEFITK